MKIDWLTYSLRSVYAVLVTAALVVIWTFFKWPWIGVIKVFLLLSATCSLVISYFVKRDRLRKEALREKICALSNDLTLQGDFTIDDFNLL